MVQVEHLSLSTVDGVVLAATLYQPDEDKRQTELGSSAEKPKKPILVTVFSATGVLQRYYAKYASYLAEEHGLTVITWDNRGIGASLHAPRGQNLKRKDFSKVNWGEKDYETILHYLTSRFPEPREIVHVGHSVGAHVFTFAPSANSLVSRAMFVCAHNPYFPWNQPLFYRWKMWTMWMLFFVPLRKVVGYFPAKALGMFENLPAGVFDDWTRWMQQPQYLCSEPKLKAQVEGYQGDILCVYAKDDEFASEKQIRSWTEMYRHAKSKTYLPIAKMGHLGMFREKNRAVWEKTAPFLLHSKL
jgi:predicted alpha/beta hydrolase